MNRLLPPDENFLKRYFTFWVQETDIKVLSKHLCVPPEYLNRWEPLLFCYRKRRSAETQKKYTLKQFKLTPERRARYLDLISKGMEPVRAALLMNIPFVVITEIWYAEDPTLADEAEYARDQLDIAVINALHKRAVGYDKNLGTESEYFLGSVGGKKIGKNGTVTTKPKKPTLLSVTKGKRTEHVPPNTQAITLWLQMRRPEWAKKLMEEQTPEIIEVVVE